MEQENDQIIQRMSDVLASQVAAGEVVERPASVVKELVENSIDAGATAVRVEIQRGGVAMIRVVDNGRGMSRVDADLCLERHATSKLLSVADLFEIRHLGFRGEALPSIASVSNVSITTRRAQDVEGTLMRCDGGLKHPPMNTGCAPGTDIVVTNLFFNTPVRRKFLKSDETEAGHVEHQLKLHALAFPSVRFTFVRDSQTVFDVPATTDVRRRIADLFGREVAEKLLRIRPANGPGVRVEGFLMPLAEARRNRRLQFVFLNGRPVEDKTVTRAVRDGYGGFPTGLHPTLFLYMDVEPGLVDVNVHPAKREIRFRRPSDVTTCIIEAVAGTLSEYARGEKPDSCPSAPAGMAPAPFINSAAPAGQPVSAGAGGKTDRPATVPFQLLRPVLTPRQQVMDLAPAREEPATVSPEREPKPVAPTADTVPDTTPVDALDDALEPATEPEEMEGMDNVPGFRYLGVLQQRYIVMENKEGLVLFSPRAARERIVFERLMSNNRRSVPAQRLLEPMLLELDSRDFGLATEMLPLMEQAGFLLTTFGRRTLRIEGIPLLLRLNEIGEFLQEFIHRFSVGEVRLKRGRNPFEPFAVQLAHQCVLKEDVKYWFRNPMLLLCELLRCEIPYCTPTGKPTMVPISLNEIGRKFAAR